MVSNLNRVTRRRFMAGTGGAIIVLGGRPALALTEDEARGLVEATLSELLDMLNGPGGTSVRAPELRRIMETRANMPLIARFSAGRIWREMSPDQQKRYQNAFAQFISVTYARRFEEFEGDPDITIGKVIDAGRKGFLVETPLKTGQGEPIAVEWLVSDRGGRVEIVDMVVEGISMATTQREEMAAMFDKRNNDIEALISDLQIDG